MNVYIVTQGTCLEPAIVGAYPTMEAAQECIRAGAEVGIDRFIDICGLQEHYDPNDDWFVINEREEV